MKVTDKRRFTQEGEARDGEEEERSNHRGTEAESSEEKKKSEKKEEAGAGAGAMPREPIDFATFIESLATVALMHMGLVEVRGEEKLPVNLDFAKEQIDILGILEEKTRGNLTPDEGQLLAAILRDLRLAFVRLREPPPRKASCDER